MTTPVDSDADTLPDSDHPTIRQLQSDVRELRREQAIARSDSRECRDATRALERKVTEMLDQYPLVAGMTARQRAGATAGLAGAVVAIAAALPQILQALGVGH